MQAKSAELRKKTQKLTKPKPVVIYKNCSYVCTYNCAYTVCTQYNTKSSHNLSDISPLIIQTVIIVQMLSTGDIIYNMFYV